MAAARAQLESMPAPPPPRAVTLMRGTPRALLESVSPEARVLNADTAAARPRVESSPHGPVAKATSTWPPRLSGAVTAVLERLSFPRARRASASLKNDVAVSFRRARAFLDVHDGWVPESVRERVRASTLLGFGALGVAVTLALVVLALRLASPADAPSASASPPESTDVSSAPSLPAPPVVGQVAAAVPAPEARTSSVAEKPAASAQREAAPLADEGSLLLNSANGFANEGRDSEAVTLIERALLRNPELRSDPRVAKVLLRTAYADEKAAVAATFALLEGPMGERGAELMYELSLARLGKDTTHRHAQAWLRSKDFAKAAALPLYIVVKLRQAKTCKEKHALLGLASGGGKEVLDYLRELDAHTTCAPDDLVNCYPCFRADSRLTDTIATLEKRIQG